MIAAPEYVATVLGIDYSGDFYTVAGSNGDIFGTTWDAANTNNDMAFNDSTGLYEITYYNVMPTSNVSFKVAKNHLWDENYPSENCMFIVENPCDVTITFDPATEEVSVTGEYVSFIQELEVYSVIAIGNGEDSYLNGVNWDPSDTRNALDEVAPGIWEMSMCDIYAFDNYQIKFAINSIDDNDNPTSNPWAFNFGAEAEQLYPTGEAINAVWNGSNCIFEVEEDGSTVNLQLDLRDFDFNTKQGAKMTVTVSPPQEPPEPQYYEISVTSDDNGTAYADTTSALSGETVHLTAEPNEGYRLKEWQVVEVDLTIEDDSFVMPAQDVTVNAIFEPIPVYTFVTPDPVSLVPFTEWTALRFDMTDLNFDMVEGDRKPSRIRLVLGYPSTSIQPKLVNENDSSKSIPFGLSNNTTTSSTYNHRMLDWSTANNPQNLYMKIESSAWNSAEPGVYSTDLPYVLRWFYSSSPNWSSDFGNGSIHITVTVTETHIVTVTAEPSGYGTVTGGGRYEVGDTVTLGVHPTNESICFVDWEVVSGDVTIEDNQFVMGHEDVEIKAIFEQIPIPYVDGAGTPQMPITEYTVIESGTKSMLDQPDVQGDEWFVVLDDVEFDERMIVDGNINLILCNGATLTAHKGIGLNGEDDSLTIWQQAKNNDSYTGELFIDDQEDEAAGIGTAGNGGEITINGGAITIERRNEQCVSSAGIGGGSCGSGGNITINGGVVEVWAAGCGIGCSDGYIGDEQSDITLNWTEASRETMSVRTDKYRGTVTLQNDFFGYSSDEIVLFSSTDIINNDDMQGITLKPPKMGDANYDGVIDVCDATAIQRHIADIEQLFNEALLLGDVNCDGIIDIADVTLVQMYIAGCDVSFGAETV